MDGHECTCMHGMWMTVIMCMIWRCDVDDLHIFLHVIYIICQITTNTQPACGDVPDLTIIRDRRSTLKNDIADCNFECLGGTPACVQEKVHEKLNLSLGCSLCWANQAACTLNECKEECRFIYHITRRDATRLDMT